MTKQGKILFGVLGLSLAVNLFLAGLWFGGKYYADPSHKMRHSPPTEFNLRHLTSHLPLNLKKEMRAQMKDQKSELHRTYMARRAVQRDIYDALSHENLDLDEVKVLMEKHKTLTNALRRPPENILIEFLPKMTVKQRQKLAKGLLKGKRSARNRPHKKPDDRPKPTGEW